MSVSSFGGAEGWVEKLKVAGAQARGWGGGKAAGQHHDPYTPVRTRIRSAAGLWECWRQRDEVAPVGRVDGTDQRSGTGVKAVWRRSSDAFWSSSLCVVVG